jgi:ABC-2 type transport system ATP-binding protein
MGRELNPRWDQPMAEERMRRLEIPLGRPVGRLSGGQQAQVALALALSKRPELLLLDEPVANLDPLARRQFLSELMAAVAAEGLTVILSSHLIADLERVADHLVILSGGRLQVAGDLERLLQEHRWLIGPSADAARVGGTVVQAGNGEQQCRMLARGSRILPGWSAESPTLEDLVLAYLANPAAASLPTPEAVPA